jgi:hypothetical protein
VRAVTIPKPNGGERTLGVPNVQDRFIQQAIHAKLSERCEPFFSENSYGFRPMRSAHDAVRAAQELVKQGKRYVVDIDLKSFFDEVNHDKLMHLLDKHVEDKSLKKLIGAILRASVQQPDGSRYKRGKGTPQGGPLSPLLANIYLDPLDKELERRGLSFVRYADDIAIFVTSPRVAIGGHALPLHAAGYLRSLIPNPPMAWMETGCPIPITSISERSEMPYGGPLARSANTENLWPLPINSSSKSWLRQKKSPVSHGADGRSR